MIFEMNPPDLGGDIAPRAGSFDPRGSVKRGFDAIDRPEPILTPQRHDGGAYPNAKQRRGRELKIRSDMQ